MQCSLQDLRGTVVSSVSRILDLRCFLHYRILWTAVRGPLLRLVTLEEFIRCVTSRAAWSINFAVHRPADGVKRSSINLSCFTPVEKTPTRSSTSLTCRCPLSPSNALLRVVQLHLNGVSLINPHRVTHTQTCVTVTHGSGCVSKPMRN